MEEWEDVEERLILKKSPVVAKIHCGCVELKYDF